MQQKYELRMKEIRDEMAAGSDEGGWRKLVADSWLAWLRKSSEESRFKWLRSLMLMKCVPKLHNRTLLLPVKCHMLDLAESDRSKNTQIEGVARHLRKRWFVHVVAVRGVGLAYTGNRSWKRISRTSPRSRYRGFSSSLMSLQEAVALIVFLVTLLARKRRGVLPRDYSLQLWLHQALERGPVVGVLST